MTEPPAELSYREPPEDQAMVDALTKALDQMIADQDR
jgi:hypothetical protein